jgi:hypothetical protein
VGAFSKQSLLRLKVQTLDVAAVRNDGVKGRVDLVECRIDGRWLKRGMHCGGCTELGEGSSTGAASKATRKERWAVINDKRRKMTTVGLPVVRSSVGT